MPLRKQRVTCPSASTSLRSEPYGSELRLGRPLRNLLRRLSRRSKACMLYGGGIMFVYILQSISDSTKFYSGMTNNLESRLKNHNSGQVRHSSRYKPWRIKNYFWFHDKSKAMRFEKHLKSGSGHAFAKSDCIKEYDDQFCCKKLGWQFNCMLKNEYSPPQQQNACKSPSSKAGSIGPDSDCCGFVK